MALKLNFNPNSLSLTGTINNFDFYYSQLTKNGHKKIRNSLKFFNYCFSRQLAFFANSFLMILLVLKQSEIFKPGNGKIKS